MLTLQNRELQIMKMVRHPNAVQLLNSFYERSKGDVYLNLVLAYMPRNLYEVCVSYTKRKERMPLEHVRVRLRPTPSPTLRASSSCTSCAGP